MVPTHLLETAMTTTLAASTTGYLALALKQTGVISPFTEGEDLSALTSADMLPTAAGLGITYTAAGRQSARNPITGDYMVNVPPPAGGNEELSGASGTYPVTLYGTVVTKTPHVIPDDIIGSKTFPEPVSITAPNQLIEYNEVTYSFAIGAWF